MAHYNNIKNNRICDKVFVVNKSSKMDLEANDLDLL